MAHKPSDQQREVYRWVRNEHGNLILIAVAGAGKTTTILNASTMTPTDSRVIIVAYNKKIADEISEKLKSKNIHPRIKAGTFHSFGFANWLRQYKDRKGKDYVQKKKVENILEDMKVPEEYAGFCTKLVSMAKNRAIGVLCDLEDETEWMNIIEHYDLDSGLPEDSTGRIISNCIGSSIIALKRSIEIADDVIDYDDMLYMPLHRNVNFWRNEWVFVDEAQDTNPARRELVKRFLQPQIGRAVFVGDPAQAIYGFTGADNDSLEIIKREFNARELPLTVTYRCPKAVVQEARQYVSHITAADGNAEGEVGSITDEAFHKLPASEFSNQAAMLCRKTAPLVLTAFALIRRNIPCHVEGKDIGQGLIAMTKKWQTNSIEVFKEKLNEYVSREVNKFLEKKEEEQAERLMDKKETLYVIMDGLSEEATLDDVRAKINGLFGDTPEGVRPKHFVLSTVHKSKGREWPTVYILDRGKYMPSAFARQQWQLEQEYNLIYVAVTRSQGRLIDVFSAA